MVQRKAVTGIVEFVTLVRNIYLTPSVRKLRFSILDIMAYSWREWKTGATDRVRYADTYIIHRIPENVWAFPGCNNNR
ncbi:unnamed protein product [Litomosoides sigmodontis]|uniref:Uncharacterized protein n=1 Tax=Litomosoides sigmodontis TaxID=42156 RepID=A0A3P6TXG3_LITSI|nr:unnamed protein product [Litomosoides sigmodontis]